MASTQIVRWSAVGVLMLFAPPGLHADPSPAAPDSGRRFIQLALGGGLLFPQFTTDDNSKTKGAGSVRLTYYPSPRRGWGAWCGFVFGDFAADKPLVTITRPYLTATGRLQTERSLYVIEAGLSWTLGTPSTNGLRPRLATGIGPYIFDIKQQFRVSGFSKDQPLTLDSSLQVRFGVGAAAGLDFDGGGPMGFSVDVSYRYILHVDIDMPPGKGSRNLSLIGLMLHITWNGKSRDRNIG